MVSDAGATSENGGKIAAMPSDATWVVGGAAGCVLFLPAKGNAICAYTEHSQRPGQSCRFRPQVTVEYVALAAGLPETRVGASEERQMSRVSIGIDPVQSIAKFLPAAWCQGVDKGLRQSSLLA